MWVATQPSFPYMLVEPLGGDALSLSVRLRWEARIRACLSKHEVVGMGPFFQDVDKLLTLY